MSNIKDLDNVRKEHIFELENLKKYLNSKIDVINEKISDVKFDDCSCSNSSNSSNNKMKSIEDIRILQFTMGQSNPTFLIELNNFVKLVLRKKPPGILLKKAHMVDREFKIITGLSSVKFPVPKPILYCEDKDVIGTEFFLMTYVEGKIFRDLRLSTLSPNQRYSVYYNYIDVMTRLHQLNPYDIGLGDLIDDKSKEVAYHYKQVQIWTNQYRNSETEKIKSMEYIINWLDSEKEKLETCKELKIVHGDFRIDNIIFDPITFEVLAVLDWELTALGDPIFDIAYACQFYHITNEIIGIGLGNFDKGFYGIPTEIELKKLYFTRMNRQIPSKENWGFLIAFGLFRLCGILQGVYKRYLNKNASSPLASESLKILKKLSLIANNIAITCNKSDEEKIKDIKKGDLFQFIGLDKFSDKFFKVYLKILDFMEENIYPEEKTFLQEINNKEEFKYRWTHKSKVLENLIGLAKKQNLFNLFLPDISGLTNMEYAVICEQMGKSFFLAPEVFNCNAPDTGNMELLFKYASDKQKKEYLEPLLTGEIRSCFAMTEKGVSSSDATNINTTFVIKNDSYVINGRKWWISGAGDPRCKFAIVMGKFENNKNKHEQHSMIIVPLNTKGVTLYRPMKVLGYDDAPHGHLDIIFNNVEVPKENIILGEGKGFEIAQGRLGPGRIHHCMRLIGIAERSYENIIDRCKSRVAFGKTLSKFDSILKIVAKCRIKINMARLLVLQAADKIDRVGGKNAKDEIAYIKIIVPQITQEIIDTAIQIHGGEGLSQDSYLAYAFAAARTLRLADGPDEVHLDAVGKSEFNKIIPKF